MLIRSLIYALDHAETPNAVKAIIWALEKRTGIRTGDLLVEQKGPVSASFSTTSGEWYEREGFRLLAANAGYGNRGYSTRSITFDAALQSAAVYAIIKILGEDMGALPFLLYQRSRDRSQITRAVEHPLYTTLHDLANPELNAGEWVEQMTAHAALTGGGYSLIERNKSVVYVWPLMPQDVIIDKNKAGRSFYIYKQGTSAEKTYDRDQIFHLRGFHLGGTNGDTILSRARHILDLTLSTQEYAGRWFANDASPGIILKRPVGVPVLSKEGVDLLKQAWKQWHRGVAESHEAAVLQEGMEAVRVDPDHQKLQMIEQRKFQVIECCRLWRMPPHKLADLERATYANIEEQNIDYLTGTLNPWLTRWKQTVNRCLLTAEERSTYYAEHEIEAFLRGRFDMQSTAWARLLEKGVYSINEVRRFLNLNPVDGGDQHYVQLNMQAVTEGATSAMENALQSAKIIPIRDLSKN